jgi:pantetheine-phosphate adenylyltransferase
MSKKVALFPGSFDPFTIGHESVVNRAMPLFDEIVIAIGENTKKPGFFSLEQRMHMIKEVFKEKSMVSVVSYRGLTVEFCKEVGARYLLRGLRTASDFEYERAIAQMNKAMYPQLESVFLLTTPAHTPINSTIVRDIILNGGDASQFVPSAIDLSKYTRNE